MGAPIQTAISKIPLLIPAEVQIIKSEPMLQVRNLADSYLSDRVLDISLFPVQPWIDVPELGFAVTVTGTLAKPELLKIATEISNKIWEIKGSKDHVYTVEESENGMVCSCIGFKYHGKCKHIDGVMNEHK